MTYLKVNNITKYYNHKKSSNLVLDNTSSKRSFQGVDLSELGDYYSQVIDYSKQGDIYGRFQQNLNPWRLREGRA